MIQSPDPRLVTPHVLDEEVSQSPALRPEEFDEFIGQTRVKSNLKTFVTSAKMRKAALDHTLFFGPPGLGKTTLATLIARTLGVNLRITSGPAFTRPGDLAAILTNLRPRDVLFIDEIHRLSTAIEEMLYPAMEDFKLDIVMGTGPTARSVRLDIAPFTLVGATTRSGLLSAPLRDRFGILLNLTFYEPRELATIVTRASQRLEITLDSQAALEIARRARGTPRIALRLLRRVRDFTPNTEITKQKADEALTRLDIDAFGLDALDRRYMAYIADHFGGGPVGIETLAAGLAEECDTLEELVEPYLLQQGLIARTPRGRVLSGKGPA